MKQKLINYLNKTWSQAMVNQLLEDDPDGMALSDLIGICEAALGTDIMKYVYDTGEQMAETITDLYPQLKHLYDY